MGRDKEDKKGSLMPASGAQTLGRGAGLFHSLKGFDFQASKSKNQVIKKSDWTIKWRLVLTSHEFLE